jgi:hypothetical protein
MDYSLIALLAVIGLTLVAANRHHRRTWPGRPGARYQRVITAGIAGLWLTIAGAIGWDISHMHGFFRGTKWVEGPIWWQVGLGTALLALAAVLARRVPPDASRSPSR